MKLRINIVIIKLFERCFNACWVVGRRTVVFDFIMFDIMDKNAQKRIKCQAL